MKDKILLGLSGLLGLLMTVTGLNKFLKFMDLPEMADAGTQLMMAFAESGWVIPLLGIAEVIGGILLILPKTRALGAIVLFPVIVGILLFHLVNDPAGTPMSVVLIAILGWIIFENKDKYLHMID